jgi:hypothetical protein
LLSSILRCNVDSLGYVDFTVNYSFRLCLILARRLVFRAHCVDACYCSKPRVVEDLAPCLSPACEDVVVRKKTLTRHRFVVLYECEATEPSTVSRFRLARVDHESLALILDSRRQICVAFLRVLLYTQLGNDRFLVASEKPWPGAAASHHIQVFSTAQKLSHPVGIRDRKTNVANKSVDQQIVIDLLSKIAAKCGGKREAWQTPPLAGPDGTCPPVLAEAIWDFQVNWKGRGLLHRVDGVADPGGRTITHMVGLTSGVCGPKIDDQFTKILTKIQTDFAGWTSNNEMMPAREFSFHCDLAPI